jgi:hypothetical protein
VDWIGRSDPGWHTRGQGRGGGGWRGITTDGSAVYPEAIQTVFGSVPHQICEFHILKELNQAVLRAVAQARKQLVAQRPSLGRGRPTAAKRKLAQKRQRLQQKIANLFEYRHLFVQRHLGESERATLQRITRGLPQLRTLRDISDEVYRLFDRRCRTDTALAKLARLRQRVQRFTQLCQVLRGLFSAKVEKALTFLDDRLLGATYNAVERGNRRYRKMQKTVYRVRTYDHIADRLALDLFREAAAQPRHVTLSRYLAQETLVGELFGTGLRVLFDQAGPLRARAGAKLRELVVIPALANSAAA